MSRNAGVASVLLGSVVLAGWWLGLTRIVRPIQGAPAMMPNTALCFILFGTSLLLLRRPHARRLWAWLARGCAAIAITLCVRSGPASAASFMLIGLGLLTLDVRRAVQIDLSEELAIGAGLVALIAAAGYTYGATALYEVAGQVAGMAPHTVIGVLVLAAGVLCLRPDRPLIALVSSRRVGGYVVRRLLIAAGIIPVLGLLVTLGLRGSLYDEPFAEALLAVAAMAIAVGLLLSTGHTLERIDAARTASERALAEREERLRDLIEQASDGVFIADLDGRYIEVNDAACRMLRSAREEIVGRTIMDFLPPRDLSRLRSSKALLMRGGTQVDEWTLIRRDGTQLAVEASAKILADGRWQALVRDISARKKAEQAADAVAEAVAQSPQGSVNAVLETITREAQSVANATYAAVGVGGNGDRPFDTWVVVGMPPELQSTLGHAPRAIGLLGLVSTLERPIRIANIADHPAFRGFPPGHPQMTSFLGVPICRHGRSIGNLYLANKRGGAEFTDADERAVERLAVRAGTAIETARLYQAEGLERAWLAAVIDQMPDGVILTNATGEARIENRSLQAFAHDTGQRDRTGRVVRYDLRFPNGQPVPIGDQPLGKALSDGTTTISLELALRHPDGRMMPVLVSAAPVFDAREQRLGAVAIYQDISTLKELERLREEWSSVVAHDLRQPVAIIAFEAERLAQNFARHRIEGSKSIERISRSTALLTTMINDLLDVSRLEARRLALKRVETDLAPFLNEAVDRLSSLASGHVVRFQTQVRPAPASIDPARVEQVLGNLISNAAKYGRRDGEIAVDLVPDKAAFTVSVVNQGGGITPADMPRLFQRFARTGEARGSGVPGLGLGLYICKGLIEAHGGRIWAENVPGEKTAFRFTIPMLAEKARPAA